MKIFRNLEQKSNELKNKLKNKVDLVLGKDDKRNEGRVGQTGQGKEKAPFYNSKTKEKPRVTTPDGNIHNIVNVCGKDFLKTEEDGEELFKNINSKNGKNIILDFKNLLWIDQVVWRKLFFLMKTENNESILEICKRLHFVNLELYQANEFLESVLYFSGRKDAEECHTIFRQRGYDWKTWHIEYQDYITKKYN